jgi:hypothetical protein
VERQTLLKFFVAISKEQRRSHVILATSDNSFQTWLSKGKAATRNLLGTAGSTIARVALPQLFIDRQSYSLLVGLGVLEVLLVAVIKRFGWSHAAYQQASVV